MFAKKCDRCGALFELYNMASNAKKPNGFRLLNIDEKGSYYSHAINDLCPECMGKFLDFMNMKEE